MCKNQQGIVHKLNLFRSLILLILTKLIRYKVCYCLHGFSENKTFKNKLKWGGGGVLLNKKRPLKKMCVVPHRNICCIYPCQKMQQTINLIFLAWASYNREVNILIYPGGATTCLVVSRNILQANKKINKWQIVFKIVKGIW